MCANFKEKKMHFLDICDEVLLDILSLVDPVDLVNIYNVCGRLRALAERIINNVVKNLDWTGTKCFPDLKPRPFDNLDRIRVNKNWLDLKFSRTPLLNDYKSQFNKLFVDDDHVYVAVNGAILKYDRLWNGEYLSTEYKLFGNKSLSEITFEKKDNVIFAGCRNGTCWIFQDDKTVMGRTKVAPKTFWELDLFPKKDIYVASFGSNVKIWNKRPGDKTLLLVDQIIDSRSSSVLKIDPPGEKLIMGDEDVYLYDLNTKSKEELLGLDNSHDLLWKDNGTLLSGHLDGSLRLFDLRTKSVCLRIDSLKQEIMESIQCDGKNAVLCGFEFGTISICDLRMKRILKEITTFNELYPRSDCINQIVAEPKYLFVLMLSGRLNVCDFSA